MAKQIKYDRLHNSEKAYRISVLVTYIFAALAVLSCAFTVPGMDPENRQEPALAVYGVVFAVYVLMLLTCAIMGAVAFKKTKKEVMAIQSVMLAISTLFAASNIKMFIVFFLYGLGMDGKVEELFGSNMEVLTDSFTTNWTMLVIAFSVNLLLAVLSLIKLIKKH